MSYGPHPWQQKQWDWRAAGNIICGGAGSGLVVATALSGAQGVAGALLMLAGLGLVGTGLLCVWFEIGRPWRALNVFLHPQRSWMSREAIVAVPLMASGLAALAWPPMAWLAAALALAYVYCQSRILQAARGIPSWRAPMVVPLIVVSGLTEGLGLLVFVAALLSDIPLAPALLLGILILARFALWVGYRQGLGVAVPAAARAALDDAGRWLRLAGMWVPLLGLAIAVLGGLSPPARAPLLALAGLSAAAAGVWLKFVLITRAGFNQGFALQKLPVRGTRRT
jgi:phenylacetyl-CoA:acceptor oxidoreductase subunit 2